MSRIKSLIMLPILSTLMATSCMSGPIDPVFMDNKSTCRNSFTERKIGEPHTDKGAIIKPYRKKDKLTRKERKAKYGKKKK